MIRDRSALNALHAEIISDLDNINQSIVAYVANGDQADIGDLKKQFHVVHCAMRMSNIHSAKILSSELDDYLGIFGTKAEYDLDDTQVVLNALAELQSLLESPDRSIDVDDWVNLINAMRLKSGKHLSSVAAIDSTIGRLKAQADNSNMKQALAKTRSFFRHALLSLHRKDSVNGFRFLNGAIRYLKIASPENSLLGSFSDEIHRFVTAIDQEKTGTEKQNIRLLGKVERVLSKRSNENKWKQTLFELQSWLKEHNKGETSSIKGLLGKSYRHDLTNLLEVLNEAVASSEYEKVKVIIKDSEQLLSLVNIQVNFIGHFGLDTVKRLREQIKQALNPISGEDSFDVALSSGRKTVCEHSIRLVNAWKLELLSDQPDYKLISEQLTEMSKSLQLAGLPLIAEVTLLFSSRILKTPELTLTQLAEVVSNIEYSLDQELENELPTGLAHSFDLAFSILTNTVFAPEETAEVFDEHQSGLSSNSGIQLFNDELSESLDDSITLDYNFGVQSDTPVESYDLDDMSIQTADSDTLSFDVDEVDLSGSLEHKSLSIEDEKEGESSDSDFDQEILEIFLEEAGDILAELEGKIDSWQGNRNEETQANIRKDFHTLKGSSRMAGCVKIGDLAWSTESMLNGLINGDVTYNRSVADAVRQSAGTIGLLVKELQSEGVEKSNIHGLKEAIDAMTDGLNPNNDEDLLDIAEISINEDNGVSLVERPVDSESASAVSEEMVLPEEILDAENWLDENPEEVEESAENTQDYNMVIGDTLGQLVLLKDKVSNYQETDKGFVTNLVEQISYNLSALELEGVSNDLGMAHQQFIAEPENNVDWINNNIDRVISIIEKDETEDEFQDGLLKLDLDTITELSFGEVTVANIMQAKEEVLGLLSADNRHEPIRLVAAAFNKSADLKEESLIVDGANALLNQMDALAAGMSVVADSDYIDRVDAAMSDKEILEVPWDKRFVPEGVEAEGIDNEFDFNENDFELALDSEEGVTEFDDIEFNEVQLGSDQSIEVPDDTVEDVVANIQEDIETVFNILEEESPASTALSADEIILQDDDFFGVDDYSVNETAVNDEALAADEPQVSTAETANQTEVNNADIADSVEEIPEEILIIREIFQQETEELMDTYAETLSQWGEDDQHELLDVIKRVLHTLKGGARLSQLYSVADEAHELEEEILYYDKSEGGDLLILLENRFFTLKENLHIAFTVGERGSRPKIKKNTPISNDSTVAFPEKVSSDLAPSDIDSSDVDELDLRGEALDDAGIEPQDIKGVIEFSDAIDDFTSVETDDVDKLSSITDIELVDDDFLDDAKVAFDEITNDSNIEPSVDIEPLEVIDSPDSTSNLEKTEPLQTPVVETITDTESEADTETERAVDNKFKLSETVRLPVDVLESLSGLVAENNSSRARLESGLRSIDEIFGEVNTTLATINDHVRSLEAEAQSQKKYNVSNAKEAEENFDSLEMDQYSRIYELSQRLAEMTSDLMDYRASISDKLRDMDVALVQQQRSGREMSSELQQTQLVSLNTLVPRVRLMARDISTEIDKKVNISFSGMASKINRHAIQKLLPALEHILRNALDHGIEKPSERSQFGKDEIGQINITAKEQQSYLELVLEDDGAGIDVEAVKNKAISKGLMGKDEQLSRQQILQFIFKSGFSTAQNVTQLSGRGVGMEIVANELRSIGGSVEVNTEKYKGTQFTLRIPVNISANTSLLLHAEGNNYAIPLVHVRAITRAKVEGNITSFEYGGEKYKLYLFEDVFNININHETSIRTIIILNSSQSAAFAVPEVEGVREITVRPISPLVQRGGGLAGASIDIDGSILMVVDPVAVIEKSEEALDVDGEESSFDFNSVEPEVTKPSNVKCFIVDDSITVRKVTARLLDRNDYQSESAKDGLDALEKLDEVQPDIILLDVEMPRMDGFEFLKILRQSSTHQNIPVIMITSRTGDKHRNTALELGVDAYLGKPYQEQELLTEIERLLFIE